jgi:hypothetical protein
MLLQEMITISRNYCIYATLCATMRCRTVRSNTYGGAQLQSLLQQ